MEAQGDRSAIVLLLGKLYQDKYIKIEEMEEKDLPLNESEESFDERW